MLYFQLDTKGRRSPRLIRIPMACYPGATPQPTEVTATCPRDKITKRLVDSLKSRDIEYVVFDAEIRGFGVRTRPSGAKSYILMYRAGRGRHAPLRKLTLGTIGKLTPDEARKLARQAVGDVAHGRDPAESRTSKRKEKTVGDLLERYVDEHVRTRLKPSTRWSAEQLIKSKIRPRFERIKIGDLTRAHIFSWHQSMSRTPIEANRSLACFRKLLSLASRDWELIDQNPAKGITPFPERKRERIPTDEELASLGLWLARAEAEATELSGCILAARLMFLTAMRLGEVLSLQWGFIDFSAGSARLPDAKAGPRTVHLGATTVNLLKKTRSVGTYVCHGIEIDKPLRESAFRGFWNRMRQSTTMTDLTPHDLRRGALTRAATLGLNAFAIRDLAGHRTLAMANRYVQRAGNALRPIADEVSQKMAAALNPKQEAGTQIDTGELCGEKVGSRPPA